MAITLTEKSVEGFEPQPKRYKVSDSKVTGLFVRVEPTGRKAYYCYYRVSGKATQIKLGSTTVISLKEARDKAITILSKALTGVSVTAERKREACSTLLGFYDERYKDWVLTQHRNPQNATRTIETTFKHWHSSRLDSLTKEVVDAWRVKQTASNSSVNRYTDVLKALLNQAVEWGYLPCSPLHGLPKLKVLEKPIRWFDPTEEEALRTALERRDNLKLADRLKYNDWLAERHKSPLPVPNCYPCIDHLTPIVELGLGTGLRLGEILALTWDSFSAEIDQVTVVGKSGRIRVVPLNHDVHNILTQWKEWVELQGIASHSKSPVFPNKQGKHMTSVKTAWNKLVKDAGLPPTGFHATRRTFGSKLISNGVNSLRVARLLGHSSVTVTERHYIGLLQDENKKAVADLMG